MKHKILSLAFGAALALGSVSAHASLFYFDVGQNYSASGTKADGPTTTGLFSEMLFTYDSTTYFEDSDGDGLYSVGDSSRGTGGIGNEPDFGIGTNAVQDNYITGFRPGFSGSPSDPAPNGFRSDWFLTFGWDNLVAEVNSFGGLTYTSGTIRLYYYDAGAGGFASRVNFMNLEVVAGGINEIGQSLNLEAEVDFTGLDGNAVVANGVTLDSFMFLEDGTSFYDSTVNGDNIIISLIDQNTDPFWLNGELRQLPALGLTGYDVDDGLVLSGQHDGSLVFAVPEPSVIALFGTGFVALGMAIGLRRRSYRND